MKRWTIDTNVPVVANGRDDGDGSVSLACREAAVQFLLRIIDDDERVVLDSDGEIQSEYRGYLRPSGQPGVGDRFYQLVLTDWTRCERVHLPRRSDGEYADLPQAIIDAGFDVDDRKFAAVSAREGIPVVNAVDSDWLDAFEVLAEHGVSVTFICGCDRTHWYAG